jgi:hypothetical protein
MGARRSIGSTPPIEVALPSDAFSRRDERTSTKRNSISSIASRRPTSRVVARLAPRRRSNARALAIAPPLAVNALAPNAPNVVMLVVGPATLTDACAAHRVNKLASARAVRVAVVVVVVDIARARALASVVCGAQGRSGRGRS